MKPKISSECYASEAEYINALERRAGLPAGFSAGSVELSFQPYEINAPKPRVMRLSAIVLDEPTGLFAGSLTQNAFPGAPVTIARRRLEGETLRGVLVNNSIANVCARSGEKDAEELLDAFAARIGGSGREFLCASTGVIGWRLPVPEMKAALPSLKKSLQTATILDVARGIMTTDLFPKVRAAMAGEAKVLAIAKGAGMIEPNMATMLVFILTDADVDRETLRRLHREAVAVSFNRISVDSDQSTSDMAILLSSGKKKVPGEDSFREALLSVYGALAEDVVRNGEGTGHVIRTVVRGAADTRTAEALGKAIINSPLVKTAAFGNDPNVGRIIMAAGDFLGTSKTNVDPGSITVSIGGHLVFEKGSFSLDADKEAQIFNHMKEAQLDPDNNRYPAHDRRIEIELDLGAGEASAAVLGSDLSYGYVRENADYRT
ncbi:MAG: bifunctional glutamate N-acetyltransferase/amino-acid acetyltransferase ArgJ [Spirochaetales bacterium]|nr:bifunctional glutamate N-acetyltransferase/amino-acid acetyltransferase ArgJ [Spirochaetales bacterium]